MAVLGQIKSPKAMKDVDQEKLITQVLVLCQKQKTSVGQTTNVCVETSMLHSNFRELPH